MAKKKVKQSSNGKLSIIIVVTVLSIAVLSLLVFFSDNFAGEAIRVASVDPRLSTEALPISDVELMDAPEIGVEAPMDVPDIEVGVSCTPVKFDDDIHTGMNGNNICQDIGKTCQWVFSERTKTYYETEIEGGPLIVDCNGEVEAEMKEYSLTEITCSGLATWFSSETCYRFSTVRSDEPKLGDVKTSEYQPFEIMCC
ncbi:hypothetical protein GOV03_03020 [Candidatus Woesearchaeota archaeon]|nr:hypothetical protein [Candidatus Woesearchaeota archaeon]